MSLNRRLDRLEQSTGEPAGYQVSYVDPSAPADPPDRFQSEAAAQAWRDEHMGPDGFHLIIVKYTDEAP
jgi:hypothetical protein